MGKGAAGGDPSCADCGLGASVVISVSCPVLGERAWEGLTWLLPFAVVCTFLLFLLFTFCLILTNCVSDTALKQFTIHI